MIPEHEAKARIRARAEQCLADDYTPEQIHDWGMRDAAAVRDMGQSPGCFLGENEAHAQAAELERNVLAVTQEMREILREREAA